MNCKPGDVAVIVRHYGRADYSDALGRFVQVTSLASAEPAYWRMAEPLVLRARTALVVADDCLRPVRDNDGEDEMLRIAGKPTELPADLIRELTS